MTTNAKTGRQKHVKKAECKMASPISNDRADAFVGPQAEVLAEADDAVSVIRATVSHETVVQWRTHFPALRDRRSRIPL